MPVGVHSDPRDTSSVSIKVIKALRYVGTTSRKSYAGRPADMWSLGVTLYTMLAGYLPFEAESDDAVADKVKVTTACLEIGWRE